MDGFEILLVEDSRADATIMGEVLKSLDAPVHLNVLSDGTKTMDFLRREGEFASAPRPHLIMLDLNLPKIEGTEILESVKKTSEWSDIPVIIFSSSKRQDEIRRCYRSHANCFVSKPQDLATLKEVLKSIVTFWFRTVELPERKKESV